VSEPIPYVNPDEIASALRKRVAELLEMDWEPEFDELADLVDPEFATMCRVDNECRKTWLEIIEMTDKLNEEMEQIIAWEIAEILANSGIDLYCEWKICFFIYKLFGVYSLKVEKALRKIQGVET